MTNRIKKFSDFDLPLDESGAEDMNLDFLGPFKGIGKSALDAIVKVAKGKFVKILAAKLGVPEESFFMKVIDSVAKQYTIEEYWNFFTQGEIPATDLAPRLAQATIEILMVEGIDPIAKKLGVKDTNGLIYQTAKQMIVNEASREQFKENLTSLYAMLLGAVGVDVETNKTRKILGKEIPSVVAKKDPSIDIESKSSGAKISLSPEEKGELKKAMEEDPDAKAAIDAAGTSGAGFNLLDFIGLT